MRLHLLCSGLLGLLLLAGGTACSQDNTSPHGEPAPSTLEINTLRNDLAKPWGIALLPNNDALVTLKAGQLLHLSLETGETLASITGLPDIADTGQGGLLDVAISPDFEDDPWIYLSYASEKNGRYGTEVGRGRLIEGQLRDWQPLFAAEPKTSGGRHFGSRLVFDREGYLFITLGDRGDRDEAQNLQSHLGSVIRLHQDGSIPQDNPFRGRSDALPEIFSYGHRNIQGAALHPETGELWVHEHGPQGGDEVNRVLAGRNYGWPVITFGKNYVTGTTIGEGTEKEGMEQPLHQWTPSIAPSGMAFYTHSAIPEWRDSLLVGALKFQLLSRLEMSEPVTEIERLFTETFGRIRDVEVTPDGNVLLLTDASGGKLIKLSGRTPDT